MSALNGSRLREKAFPCTLSAQNGSASLLRRFDGGGNLQEAIRRASGLMRSRKDGGANLVGAFISMTLPGRSINLQLLAVGLDLVEV